MEFDVISVTEEQLKNYTAVQMQLLRNAQKKKDELTHNYNNEVALYKKLFFTNDMKESSLIKQKTDELQSELNYQIGVIVEQLEYALLLNEPYPDDTSAPDVGYIVDYSLTYNERYKIVRDYYLSIEDPAQRMALYSADEVAKKYLSSYYSTLYDVLYSYSK